MRLALAGMRRCYYYYYYLCYHFALLQVVGHQHHNGLAVEHKVQHSRAELEKISHVPAEEMDVDQMLQCRIANHGDAQLLSDPAAGAICGHQVVTVQLARRPLWHKSLVEKSMPGGIATMPYGWEALDRPSCFLILLLLRAHLIFLTTV